MLGSMKLCSVCASTSFERTARNRATQCAVCHTILEERARSALPEFSVVTMSEEVHCAVTPDLQPHDDRGIPLEAGMGDPFCTPGFISAFRMLSPLQEPVYGATAGTISGELAEMERLLAHVLQGDDGKSSGPGTENDAGDPTTVPPRADAPRADARHMVVAYFEIIDLSDVLGIDRETANLAVRLFEKVALSVSMRNKQIESLAAATLLVALELRHVAHAEWLSTHPDGKRCDGEEYDPSSVAPFPADITTSRMSVASGAREPDLERDVRIVRAAFAHRLQSVGDSCVEGFVEGDHDTPSLPRVSDNIVSRVGEFAAALGLDEDGRKLCSQIVENALALDVCPRRAPISVAAAGVYLGTQILGLRFTQAQVCRVMRVTEVTLRKVYRELSEAAHHVVPEGHSVSFSKPTAGRRRRQDIQAIPSIPRKQGGRPRSEKPTPEISQQRDPSVARAGEGSSGPSSSVEGADCDGLALSASRDEVAGEDAADKTGNTIELVPPDAAGSSYSAGAVQSMPPAEVADDDVVESVQRVDEKLSQCTGVKDNNSVSTGCAPVPSSLPSSGEAQSKESQEAATGSEAQNENSGGCELLEGYGNGDHDFESQGQEVGDPDTEEGEGKSFPGPVFGGEPGQSNGQGVIAENGEGRTEDLEESEEATLERQKQIMMSMIQDPEMVKAFANAMSMLPAFSAPPLPPPLPNMPRKDDNSASDVVNTGDSDSAGNDDS